MAIHKSKCPKCDALNAYDNGDESDLGQMDVEALKCYNCEHRWLLPEVDWITLGEAELTDGIHYKEYK